MSTPEPTPSPFRFALSFLLVSACWYPLPGEPRELPHHPSTNTPRGLTTPFIRAAAVSYRPRTLPPSTSVPIRLLYTVLDLVKNPRYALPLLLNLTGSVWFFLLIGKAELSLTVPIVNSLALIWTVLGERVLGEKVGWETWAGVGLVCAGVWCCVVGKS